MRKEVLFAIIAGLVFGLVIAFGIWRANSALKTKNENIATSSSTNLSESPTPTSTPVNGIELSIAKPSNLDVVTTTPSTVSGITGSNSWVTISTDTNDYVFQASQSGSFQEDVDLNSGINHIVVTAFDNSGKAATQKFILVYSSELNK